jgi:hypothetical protein
MPRFRNHVILQVHVTSEVCEAESPEEAFRHFYQSVDFERLLRNVTGDRIVNSVAFSGIYERAVVDALDENDQMQGTVLEASGADLFELLPKRTSSSAGN